MIRFVGVDLQSMEIVSLEKASRKSLTTYTAKLKN